MCVRFRWAQRRWAQRTSWGRVRAKGTRWRRSAPVYVPISGVRGSGPKARFGRFRRFGCSSWRLVVLPWAVRGPWVSGSFKLRFAIGLTWGGSWGAARGVLGGRLGGFRVAFSPFRGSFCSSDLTFRPDSDAVMLYVSTTASSLTIATSHYGDGTALHRNVDINVPYYPSLGYFSLGISGEPLVSLG